MSKFAAPTPCPFCGSLQLRLEQQRLDQNEDGQFTVSCWVVCLSCGGQGPAARVVSYTGHFPGVTAWSNWSQRGPAEDDFYTLGFVYGVVFYCQRSQAKQGEAAMRQLERMGVSR